MEDTKKIQTAQAKDTAAETQSDKETTLKSKYGNVYRVGMIVPIDDEKEQEYAYYFKRPSVPSYDRYLKTAAQIGITKASKAFMLDSVVDGDKDRLTRDMEENPGIAITIGNKLTEILGLTNTANLKKL
jgi:hypothetical protein